MMVLGFKAPHFVSGGLDEVGTRRVPLDLYRVQGTRLGLGQFFIPWLKALNWLQLSMDWVLNSHKWISTCLATATLADLPIRLIQIIPLSLSKIHVLSSFLPLILLVPLSFFLLLISGNSSWQNAFPMHVIQLTW